MGGFLGYDQFRQAFGTETDPGGHPRISPAWRAGIQNGAQAGSIIGLCINGYISERWGYKKTMYVTLMSSVLFNFLHFFAQNVNMILAGSILLGLPWGIFQTLTVSYASEIMPSALRPYLTTYSNLCWVCGQLASAGVLRGCQTLGNEWSWRIPTSIQLLWVPFIFVGVWHAPESPWWLVRKGRFEAAHNAIARCATP